MKPEGLPGKALEHFLSEADNDAQKGKIEQAFNDMELRDFTRYAKELLGSNNCPPKWHKCGDGSCVPPGETC